MRKTMTKAQNGRVILCLACLLGPWLAASCIVAAPPPIGPGSWTLAILPDTQYYTQYGNGVFEAQTQFLADNKAALNLKYVLHEGDVTQSNSAPQWAIASRAMASLERVGVPYSLAVGNHDLEGNARTRNSLISRFFPKSRLDDQPTFAGVYPGEPDNTSNSYSLFTAGDVGWLVIALEYGPRDLVLDWADGLLKQYPGRKAMVVTHAYLYPGAARVDWAAHGASQHGNPHDNDGDGLADNQGFTLLPGGVNDGGEIWTALKNNPNLLFVFGGHFTSPGSSRWNDPGAAAYLASTADDGHIVHQMLANYQWVSKDNGYLRLLEFQSDGHVHVRTYSPNKDASLTGAAHDFIIPVNKPIAASQPGPQTRASSRPRYSPASLY